MKRYSRIILVTAWILVVTMLITTPASAAITVNLSDYETNVTDYGSYKVHDYSYSAGHASRLVYSNSSGSAHEYFDTPTIMWDYSNRTQYSAIFSIGFVNSFKTYKSGNFDAIGVSDIINHEYFKQLTVTIPIKIKSSVATTCEFSGGIYGMGSSGSYTSSTYESSTQSINLPAGEYVEITVTKSVSSFGSYVDSIVPFVVVTFRDPPSSGTVTIDSYYFTAQAKIGTGIPDFPVFKTNVGSSYTYIRTMDADPLTVSASVSDGGMLSYKWYESDKNSTSGGTLVASGSEFTPPTYTLGTKYYYCVVTNTKNGQESSSYSNVATVNIINEPKEPQITQNLGVATLEYRQGDTAAPLFIQAISLDGGKISYQWYVNNAASTDGGSMISGATSSSYVPPCTDVGINYYYCEVTNTLADYSASTLSSVAGIRVVPPPDHAKAPVITSDLSTTPVTYEKGNAAAPLRIGAISPDGGVLTYQWYKLVKGSGQALAGEIYATFTPDTVEVGESYYYCVVTNSLNETSSSVTSSTAHIIVAADETKGLIRTIIDKIADLFRAITNIPSLIVDGIKSLFIPDAEAMAAYQDKWYTLLSSRFGAIYESVVLIDEFGNAISEQAELGIVKFPEVTIDIGAPWTFGGWDVKVVPDGFDAVISVLKMAINIVCTFSFVNGLRRRFEGVIGGA